MEDLIMSHDLLDSAALSLHLELHLAPVSDEPLLVPAA
jgi:hypothetical protein